MAPYCKYSDVLRYAQTADDPSLKASSAESYRRFTAWIRPQGLSECRTGATFAVYLWRARPAARESARAALGASTTLLPQPQLEVILSSGPSASSPTSYPTEDLSLEARADRTSRTTGTLQDHGGE